MKYSANTKNETIEVGKEVGKILKSGDVVLLHGDLGAGKTTLVKGIAKALKIKENIVSPTFTLMQTYKIEKKSDIKNLVHIDTYRLENEEELIEIGIEDYLGDSSTICLIEWPEKLTSLLKNKKTIDITIVQTDKQSRKIKILGLKNQSL